MRRGFVDDPEGDVADEEVTMAALEMIYLPLMRTASMCFC